MRGEANSDLIGELRNMVAQSDRLAIGKLLAANLQLHFNFKVLQQSWLQPIDGEGLKDWPILVLQNRVVELGPGLNIDPHPVVELLPIDGSFFEWKWNIVE